jgi:hypothetical protein
MPCTGALFNNKPFAITSPLVALADHPEGATTLTLGILGRRFDCEPPTLNGTIHELASQVRGALALDIPIRRDHRNLKHPVARSLFQRAGYGPHKPFIV